MRFLRRLLSERRHRRDERLATQFRRVAVEWRRQALLLDMAGIARGVDGRTSDELRAMAVQVESWS